MNYDIKIGFLWCVLAFAFFQIGWQLHPDTKEVVKEKFVIVETQPMIRSDVMKVNGDCALVEPPCWHDFKHTLLKLTN